MSVGLHIKCILHNINHFFFQMTKVGFSFVEILDYHRLVTFNIKSADKLYFSLQY